MDFMTQLTAEAEHVSVENFNLQESLDGYVADLRALYAIDCTAMEAEGGGKAALVEGIKIFVNKAKNRLLELFRTIVTRLQQMVDAVKNRFTKPVKVPDDLGKAYEAIYADLEKVSNESNAYFVTVWNFNQQLARAEQNLFHREEKVREVFAAYDDRIDKIKEVIRHMESVDVLGNRSVDEYVSNLREDSPRGHEVNVGQQQSKLNKMSNQWRANQLKCRNMVDEMGRALNQNEFAAKISGKDTSGIQQTRNVYSRIFNTSMATCAGMMKSISHAQKYLTIFRRLASQAPVSANVREAGVPNHGHALPARA